MCISITIKYRLLFSWLQNCSCAKRQLSDSLAQNLECQGKVNRASNTFYENRIASCLSSVPLQYESALTWLNYVIKAGSCNKIISGIAEPSTSKSKYFPQEFTEKNTEYKRILSSSKYSKTPQRLHYVCKRFIMWTLECWCLDW